MPVPEGVFLGIDFSGNALQWAARCPRPSVWIATLADGGRDLPRLAALLPVQALPGDGTPFERLVGLLRAGGFVAAAIDAPFSIPDRFLPPGGHAALLRAVARLPVEPGRPFARGRDLLQLAHAIASPEGAKPLRETERVWSGQGINTRSTLWNGARAGAPFTVACLTLLARAGRPIWPWQSGPGMLAEAFPAAQLRQWCLPHDGYGKPAQSEVRSRILDGLAGRLRFEEAHRVLMREQPDALDATLAAFGGIAATRTAPVADPPRDGLIAVLGYQHVPLPVTSDAG